MSFTEVRVGHVFEHSHKSALHDRARGVIVKIEITRQTDQHSEKGKCSAQEAGAKAKYRQPTEYPASFLEGRGKI